MTNKNTENAYPVKHKKERKDELFMLRITESDEEMLRELSYRLDRSKSDVLRRALKLFYYAMEDKND